jgi:hypothetical protein
MTVKILAGERDEQIAGSAMARIATTARHANVVGAEKLRVRQQLA